MGYKRFALRFIGLFFTITLGNALLNFILNPYEIFEHQLLGDGTYHNQRYEKINFLKNNHQRFNAYLVGSSRIGFITPQKIETYLPGSRFYNAWVSSGNPLDAQIFIDWLLRNHYEVKYLLIQIGLDHAIKIVDYRLVQDMQRLWHYDVTLSDPMGFYNPYIFGFLTQSITRKMQLILSKQKISQLEDIQSGIWDYTTRKKARNENLGLYIRNETTFHKPLPPFPYDSIQPQQLQMLTQALKDIDKQCQSYNIQCIFVTAPLYYKETQRYPSKLRDFILTILAQSLSNGFWHFGYLNSITTDEHNYYESTHQLPEIDSMMLDKIFQHSTNNIPKDFGIFITKENFESSMQYLHTIEQEFQK